MTPPDARPRCAIYTRLSKEDEDKRQPESESIQNQKALLGGYAAQHGWEIYQVYCDEDYSGADGLRPDFNRMIAAAEQGCFQILLCKSQSRFTRDMELVEKYIHGLFPLWGIRFIAVADNADSEIRGNKKARQINGLVNQWYLEDLSDNIRMVFDLKRREGKYIGGSPLYGYRKHPADKNKLIPDPPAAAVVRQIFRWSLEGRGRQQIAALLNGQGIPGPACYKSEQGWGPAKGGAGLWSKTAVWRILHNEMYTGVMIQGRRKKASYKSDAILDLPEAQWFKVEGVLEPIVSREVFMAVQRALGLRVRSSGKGEVHPLAGLVTCAVCGSTMRKSSNGRQSYLRCAGCTGAGGARGTRPSVRLDRLIDLVSQHIRSYVRAYYRPDPRDIRPQKDARRAVLEQEQKAILSQLARRDQALKALYLDKAAGILGESQFIGLNRDFLAEKGRLERRLAQVEGALSEEEPPQEALLERAEELLALDPVPRALITALVERIEVGGRDPGTGRQEATVFWRF